MATSNRLKPVSPASRMVVVTGNKGGCGKSTFARGLLDIYHHAQIPHVAYDSDTQNPQLFRHYNKVTTVSRIDIALRGGADSLLEDMERSRGAVILLDLPAGAGSSFQKYEQDIQLIELAAGLGYRLTLVSVISRVKDSVNALRQLMDYCGDRVDYITTKNLHFGDIDKFKRFDQSKTKTQFLAFGGVELAMPDLFDDTYDVIDEKDLTFRSAVQEGSPLTLANRSRVNQWLKTMGLEAHKASHYLGLGG
jgi:energy-coupling factor transporter ATP-binding protein EcfA2